MALDFPVATQVGQEYTDETSGKTFVVAVVGPPAVWKNLIGGAQPLPEDFVTIATTQTITGTKTFDAATTTFNNDVVISGSTSATFDDGDNYS